VREGCRYLPHSSLKAPNRAQAPEIQISNFLVVHFVAQAMIALEDA
jgi:hypothetical protein